MKVFSHLMILKQTILLKGPELINSKSCFHYDNSKFHTSLTNQLKLRSVDLYLLHKPGFGSSDYDL